MPDRGPLAFLPATMADVMGFAGGPGTHDPGRINYGGVSLKMLLSRAHKVQPDQISGPKWLGAERYVIEATLPPGTTAAQLELMLQDLLTERFRISLHREVKNLPVYRLKIAKNGPRFNAPKELPHYADEDEGREANIPSIWRGLRTQP